MKPNIRAMKQPQIIGGITSPHPNIPPEPLATQPSLSASASDPIDDRPRSVYEIVTRQMLEELKSDVAEVKGRINTLLWLVAGAVLMEMVMRVVK